MQPYFTLTNDYVVLGAVHSQQWLVLRTFHPFVLPLVTLGMEIHRRALSQDTCS